MLKHVLTGFAGMIALGACTHQASGYTGPAILESEAEIAPLMSQLSELIGRANIELGADNPLSVPFVTVLPPPAGPYEGNNPAIPTSYRIELRNGSCFLTHPGSGFQHELTGISCIPFTPAD